MGISSPCFRLWLTSDAIVESSRKSDDAEFSTIDLISSTELLERVRQFVSSSSFSDTKTVSASDGEGPSCTSVSSLSKNTTIEAMLSAGVRLSCNIYKHLWIKL